MDLLTLPAGRPEDILAVRAASRALGAELGLDEPDQVRLATALSEVGREVLSGSALHEVTYSVEERPTREIVVTFVCGSVSMAAALERSPGVAAARRLVDRVDVGGDPEATRVTVAKVLSPRSQAPEAEQLVRALRAAVPPSPLEELWSQNTQLATALDELRAREQEARRLNAELEETNRGVMAMYGQLSEELDETNRGVVALYAELDEKSVQLQEASRAKSRFFAAVSHELRSPVTSILGLARVLGEADADPLSSEQGHQVALVESAAADLLELVNQLLDLAKAEAGRLEPNIQVVDLPALAAELRGALRPLVDECRVQVVVDVDDAVGDIETDRALLGQILRNLLVNAVRFTEDGEIRLSIGLTESGQQVCCEVSDSGIGIAAEHQERVFEEFFQVPGPLQTRSRGTGLGLAYSRRVATTLGGDLSLHSEVGRGSSFTLCVPTRWNAALGRDISPPATPKDVAGRSVLVVDDDEGFRTVLRGMLQGSAQLITEAQGGREALELMGRARPDVVFLDLRMPDIDGVTVLARMAAEPHLRDVPVVVVTSVDLGIEVPSGLGGAHALLAKSEVTRERVEAVLAGLPATGAP